MSYTYQSKSGVVTVLSWGEYLEKKMKEQIKTVYTCDHCKKKLFVKNAMVRHEEFCGSNPENIPICSGCEFLEETEKDIYFDGYYGEEKRTAKSFRCTKKDIGLYPLKVVRLGIIDKYPETFHNEILMPTECEDFNFNPGF